MSTYDETKHARGGNPVNTGEYSEKSNSVPETALPGLTQLERNAQFYNRKFYVFADGYEAQQKAVALQMDAFNAEVALEAPTATQAVFDWVTDYPHSKLALNKLVDGGGNEVEPRHEILTSLDTIEHSDDAEIYLDRDADDYDMFTLDLEAPADVSEGDEAVDNASLYAEVIARDSGVGIFGQGALETVLDRNPHLAAKVSALTVEEVEDLYTAHLGPAIDGIEEALSR